MTRKLLLILGLLWSAIASAQFTPGQVLTAAELNTAFSAKAPIPTGTCLGTSSALNYSLSGNVFSCNASINALTLGGATFSSPGPIGSVSTSSGAFSSISTPSATIGGGTINATSVGATSASTGAFTTLTASSTVSGAGFTTLLSPYLLSATAASTYATIAQATTALAATGGSLNGVTVGSTTPSTVAATTLSSTGNFTPAQTNGIVGTTTNNNANAGSVGEYVTNTVLATSPANGTPYNAASISLTAGDWDVSGTISFIDGTGAISSTMNSSLSTTTATQNAAIGFMSSSPSVTAASATTTRLPTPVARFSLSTTTTIFLVGVVTFSGGTLTSDGLIRARRVR